MQPYFFPHCLLWHKQSLPIGDCALINTTTVKRSTFRYVEGNALELRSYTSCLKQLFTLKQSDIFYSETHPKVLLYEVKLAHASLHCSGTFHHLFKQLLPPEAIICLACT